MSIKTVLLAAATVAATATVASADINAFGFGDTFSGSSVDLGTVRAADAGVVEVYSFHGGEIGPLLGSTPVNAGANQDVRVSIPGSSIFDVIAILKVDGQEVAVQEFDRM